MNCEAELCTNWTGDGCICQVLGIEPEHGTYCECSECDERRHDPEGAGTSEGRDEHEPTFCDAATEVEIDGDRFTLTCTQRYGHPEAHSAKVYWEAR